MQTDHVRRNHVYNSVAYNDGWRKFDEIMSAFRLCGYLDQRNEEPAREWDAIDIRDALDTTVVWG
jgi:hypothetical protein